MSPTPVPDNVIDTLKGLEYNPVDYKIGDEIRVKDGTFKDYCGQIQSVDSESRVFVLLEFFNSLKKVKINRSQIEPV
tara:strand:- start:357 stop:587 length:231 start_codon:yes stop_codon:yes gene_type:complete